MPAVLPTASHIGEDSERMDAKTERKQAYKAQMRPDYKMILRRHSVQNVTDTVLYAR